MAARIRPFVDQECLRTLYYGHAYSFLEYAVLAWGAASKSNLKRVSVLQNRVLRLMALHGPLKDVELNKREIYANLQLSNFEDIYQLETSKFMHRCCKGTLPKSFESYFKKKNYSYSLRSKSKNPFRIQITRTEAYKRWLVNNGLRVWEGLDNETKKLPFIPFKTKIKKSILNAYTC